MLYLAHTAHLQFLALLLGCVAWILTMIAAGLNEWRLWYVADNSTVTSGVAWVGIWRACFYSHALSTFEFCRNIDISEGFVPMEISVGQVLLAVAWICGLSGNICACFAVRMAYFSMDRRYRIRLVFSAAGALYVLAAVCSLVPLCWNIHSVLTNSTIHFPPEFHLPPAPKEQRVGSAVFVGIGASVLNVFCGLTFLCYRYTKRQSRAGKEPGRCTRDSLGGPWTLTTLSQKPALQNQSACVHQESDNPVFSTEEDYP